MLIGRDVADHFGVAEMSLLPKAAAAEIKKGQLKIGKMWMEWKNCMKWLPPKQCELTRPVQGGN